jgi:hypothetical protein
VIISALPGKPFSGIKHVSGIKHELKFDKVNLSWLDDPQGETPWKKFEPTATAAGR